MPVNPKTWWGKCLQLAALYLLLPVFVHAQSAGVSSAPDDTALIILLVTVLLSVLVAVLLLFFEARGLVAKIRTKKTGSNTHQFEKYLENMNSNQIEKILQIKHRQKYLGKDRGSLKAVLIIAITLLAALFPGYPLFAQAKGTNAGIFSEGGILITITLIMIPILAGIVLMVVKLSNILQKHRNRQALEEANQFADYLATVTGEEATEAMAKRKVALD
ncbi:hypothetical protein BH11BAC5_BH11BAC5_39190 [soil metagenome]